MDWLSLASSAISAIGGFLTNEQSAGYNAVEAQKDRDFQERMYNRQIADNINLWKMQNKYNLPSAQLERIKNAGLNPLLMYGQGGVSNTVSSPAASASAPSGSKASSHFANPLDMANLALLNAQIKNIDADTEQKKSTSKGIDIQNEINEQTKNVQIAMKYGDLDLLNASIRKLTQDVYNSVEITTQQVLTMMQAREYQIKQYNLSEYQVGQQIEQGWKAVETNRISANASFKSACAQWKDACTRASLAPAEIANLRAAAQKLAFETFRGRKLMPYEIRTMNYNNVGQVVGVLANMAGIEKTKSETLVNNMKGLRMALGNDSGIGSILAPLTMPIGLPQHGDVINDLYNSLGL